MHSSMKTSWGRHWNCGFCSDRREAAERAEARILAEIDRLTRVASGHDPASEFRRWQAAARAPMILSPELFELLLASDRWRQWSEGAFDPRVEILTRLWARSARLGRLPTPVELDEARGELARPAWRFDPDHRRIERLSDCPLSLDAIAKGYIVERACAAALTPGSGVRGLLLNIGGDLRVCGADPRILGIAPPWADAESAEPIAVIAVADRAVATSGRSQRGFDINGQWYSHILDPRTGWPVKHVACATVIAPRSADADALATICNVLRPEESLRLVASLPDVECLIVGTDGRLTRSPGWQRFEQAGTALSRSLGAAHRPPDPPPPFPLARPARGGRTSNWPSISRSISPRGRGGVTAGPTSPSGSRTKTGSRSAT